MGKDAECEVRFNGKVSVGKALLETDEIIFRGDFRLVIPLKSIQEVDATAGDLRVRSAAGTAVFKLGPQAEKWAHKIRNPRTLIDKLDVKPGLRVSLCGIRDTGFHDEVAKRAEHVSDGKATKDSDLIFFGAEAEEDLARIAALQKALKSNGAIWIVYPKGKLHITENHVRQAGLQAGLVDIKVARFSDTHTALKFVIPVAKRAKA